METEQTQKVNVVPSMKAWGQETVHFDGGGLIALHVMDGIGAGNEALAPLERSEKAGFPEDLSVVPEHFSNFVTRR